MVGTCALNDMNVIMKSLGIFILIILLSIVLIYLMYCSRNKHSEILENFTSNEATLTNHNYGSEHTGPYADGDKKTITGDITLRDCQVYFVGEDQQGDCDEEYKANPNTTCKYVFKDDWKEIANIKVGEKTNDYPNKIYNQSYTKTDINNHHLTAQCVKKFESDIDKRYIYRENELIGYDHDGSNHGNTLELNYKMNESDEYAKGDFISMTFGKNDTPQSNYSNVINSICSKRYTNILENLLNLSFYKFIFINNRLSDVQMVNVNNVNGDYSFVVDETFTLGEFLNQESYGLQYKSGNIFTVFKNITQNSGSKKIYTFSYNYLCSPGHPILEYTSQNKIINNNTFINISSPTVSKDMDLGKDITEIKGRGEYSVNWSLYSDRNSCSDKNCKSEILARLQLIKSKKIKAIDSNIERFNQFLTTRYYSKLHEFVNNADVIKNSIINKSLINILKIEKKNIGFNGYVGKNKGYKPFDYKPGFINTKLSLSGSTGGGDYGITTVIIDSGTGNFKRNVVINPVSIAGSTDKYLQFLQLNPGEEYKVSFGKSLLCDILVVGGGHGGVGQHGGSGGAVIYERDFNLNRGEYKIKVAESSPFTREPRTATEISNDSYIKNSQNNVILKAMGGKYADWYKKRYPYKRDVWHEYYYGTYKSANLNKPITLRSPSGGMRDGNIGNVLNNNLTLGSGGFKRQANASEHEKIYYRCNPNLHQSIRDGGDGVPVNITGSTEYYAPGGGSGIYQWCKGWLSCSPRAYYYRNWRGHYRNKGQMCSRTGYNGKGGDVANNRGQGGRGGSSGNRWSNGTDGGSGTIIIRVKKASISLDEVTIPSTVHEQNFIGGDEKKSPNKSVELVANTINKGHITMIVFLEKGFYKLFARLNHTNYKELLHHTKLYVYKNEQRIQVSEQISNRAGNLENKIANEYINISDSGFYKMVYYYKILNTTTNTINSTFNLFADFSKTSDSTTKSFSDPSTTFSTSHTLPGINIDELMYYGSLLNSHINNVAIYNCFRDINVFYRKPNGEYAIYNDDNHANNPNNRTTYFKTGGVIDFLQNISIDFFNYKRIENIRSQVDNYRDKNLAKKEIEKTTQTSLPNRLIATFNYDINQAFDITEPPTLNTSATIESIFGADIDSIITYEHIPDPLHRTNKYDNKNILSYKDVSVKSVYILKE